MGYKQLQRQSDNYGVVVTLKGRSDGSLLTVHQPGKGVLDPLSELLSRFDPSEWQVVCISTPQTIYDDLIFRRKILVRGEKYWGDLRAKGENNSLVQNPEMSLLGKAGCADFL